ncbi:hypothetical protein EVB78_134 [Rhizobium phage RHph_N1_15]|nr:hypothetical protein EVB78_134 [Rhizobium phage RHph_N1_15]QIG75196.1 hypothetical protein EVC15_134 [Rhizobium phage RHph_N2_6]
MTVSEAWNMRCPKCGSDENLDVEVKAFARLMSDGTDCDESVNGDHTWDDQSPCTCAACGWEGKAGDAEISSEGPSGVNEDPSETSDDEEPCRTCGEAYDHYGDGYDGECPSCADRSAQREEDGYPENWTKDDG